MNLRPLTDAEVAQFHEDGYICIRGFFDAEEMALLLQTARADQEMQANHFPIKDTAGRTSKLSLWNQPGENLYGVVARSRRIVEGAERLLGGEVYHYHSKMMLKEPFVGGAWEWHQDYGYWYNNGCLFPDMLSCLIAVDRATPENGCLQVLRGSHKMGRIEHGRYGEQTGADPERVRQAMQRLELVYCALEPGDALFFHSNTLHCSAANESPNPRWSLICCYNKASNDPYKESHHPRYVRLEKAEDEEIKRMGAKGGSQVAYLKPEEDATTGAGKS